METDEQTLSADEAAAFFMVADQYARQFAEDLIPHFQGVVAKNTPPTPEVGVLGVAIALNMIAYSVSQAFGVPPADFFPLLRKVVDSIEEFQTTADAEDPTGSTSKRKTLIDF